MDRPIVTADDPLTERLRDEQLDPCILVIFGGTGDLAWRKLYPAIYSLYRRGELPTPFTVVGIGRSVPSEDAFREEVWKAVKAHAGRADDATRKPFLDLFAYFRLDIRDRAGFGDLQQFLNRTDEELHTERNRLFYLAVAPEHFSPIVEQLAANRLVNGETGWQRVVIEKPFGRDLQSARRLNEEITRVFDEGEIYRIDHYLGKAMLRNTLVIRFANSIFEPLWNHKYIDNIQISVNETDGIGLRGRYYEQAGALSDMVQNHLMQLLSVVAMEPPVDLSAAAVRDEKVKVIRSLQPLTPERVAKQVVRGQYGEGGTGAEGRPVPAYRGEEWVEPGSDTETFVAMKLFIENFRWAGVPIYLRTGKRLPSKSAEIVIEFKSLPGIPYFKKFGPLPPNLLVVKVQPDEGVFFQFNAKGFGTDEALLPVKMDYYQNNVFPGNTPEAYERLLQDAILGDQTLFARWDEVENAWAFVKSISDAWSGQEARFPNYAAGTWGPRAADELLARDGRKWWVVHDAESADL